MAWHHTILMREENIEILNFIDSKTFLGICAFLDFHISYIYIYTYFFKSIYEVGISRKTANSFFIPFQIHLFCHVSCTSLWGQEVISNSCHLAIGIWMVNFHGMLFVLYISNHEHMYVPRTQMGPLVLIGV